MKKDILNNQSINSSLLHFAPSFQRKEAVVPPPQGGRRFGFSMPETFKMLEPCKNLGGGKVRLTYYNPDAKEAAVVGIGGSIEGTYPMVKDEDGYFTVELQMPAGVHVHRYLVDGVSVCNPQMPISYNSMGPCNFLEAVDENAGDWYLMKDVPHGDLRMEYYRSSYTGRWKACWIYTPSGYEQNPDKKYPVLYLQHGAGEDETGWIDMGKVNLILDNMIAAGECEEMLVVLNCGFAYKPEEEMSLSSGGFEQELINDCMPFIEENYRVKLGSENTALAGLSMGSSQAQRIVLKNLDKFSYLGVIIGSISPERSGYPKEVFDDIPALNKKLKLFFASNGEQEGSCEDTRAKIKELKEKGLEGAYFYSYKGYHEFTVCRNSLHELLPLLFK